MNFITFDFMNLTPAYSQEAWPGAIPMYMPGSNHSQMKNDRNTKDNLKLIWSGGVDSWFFINSK